MDKHLCEDCFYRVDVKLSETRTDPGCRWPKLARKRGIKLPGSIDDVEPAYYVKKCCFHKPKKAVEDTRKLIDARKWK